MSSHYTAFTSIFPMADSLIVHTAEEFLEVEEAFVWARCSFALLRAMRSYRIDRVVPIVQLLCRSEGRGLLPAVTIPDIWPHSWPKSLRVRLETLVTTAAAARPSTVPAATDSHLTVNTEQAVSVATSSAGAVGVLSSSPQHSTEIGRVIDVEIDSTLFADDRIVTYLVHLPPCVSSIEFTHYRGTHPIRLPSSCTTLMFGATVRTTELQTMELHATTLTELLFDRHSLFNQPLELLRLPSTLHTLHLGYYFNQPVEHLELPASLTDLHFGRSFNQPVEALRLPAGLRSLRFAAKFKHPIERLKLPSSLTFLQLGSRFNHPLVEWHPPTSLTQLILSHYWQLPADQLRLPPSLLELKLPFHFNHPITDALLQLPSTLRSFASDGSFNQSLAGITQWPQSLTSIKLDGEFFQPMDDWIPPPQLMTLELGTYEWPLHRLRLPSSLTSLTLCPLHLKDPAEEVVWPPFLFHLDLQIGTCDSSQCVLRTLPNTLKTFKLSGLAQQYHLDPSVIHAWISLPVPTDCKRKHDSEKHLFKYQHRYARRGLQKKQRQRQC